MSLPLIDPSSANPFYCPAISASSYVDTLRRKLERRTRHARTTGDRLFRSFARILQRAVEGSELAKFLYGDELVFNSGLSYDSQAWLMDYLQAMDGAGAGGVIIALREGKRFPEEAVDWCNARRLPLFSASWKTPYIDIMRKFSEILLKNEQRETNLIASLNKLRLNRRLITTQPKSQAHHQMMQAVIQELLAKPAATKTENDLANRKIAKVRPKSQFLRSLSRKLLFQLSTSGLSVLRHNQIHHLSLQQLDQLAL